MPLEAQDDAAIGILSLPPTTGETNTRGPLAGIVLLLAAMTALVLRRRLRRPTR